MSWLTFLTVKEDNKNVRWTITEIEYVLLQGWRCIVQLAHEDGQKTVEAVGGGKSPSWAFDQALQDALNRITGKLPGVVTKPSPVSQVAAPGYLGHAGPTQCIDCSIKRPTVAQVQYWGFMCCMCTRIFCVDCGRKDGIVKGDHFANPGMACRHCRPQIPVAAAPSEFDKALKQAQDATKQLGRMPRTRIVREGARSYVVEKEIAANPVSDDAPATPKQNS